MPDSGFEIEWRGRERYQATWDYQLALHARRRAGECRDTLVLVEHEPVVTLGRHGDSGHLVVDRAALQAAGIDYHHVERGGDITYHGPGQLVGYPVFNLRERGLSVRELLRGLEESLIATVAEYGITAGRIPGLAGVWQGEAKLAALGVAVQGGVSFHGFALNVNPDLSHYRFIVPCGISNKRVSSIASACGREVTLEEVRPVCIRCLRAVFDQSTVVRP